jgi:hypothetical protein
MAKPTELIINLAFSEGTLIENEPSAVVCVPVLAPFYITEAFATGAPLVSVTLPVTTLSWANICAENNSRGKTTIISSLLIVIIFCLKM